MNKIEGQYRVAILKLLSEMSKGKSKRINRNQKHGLPFIHSSIRYAMALIKSNNLAEAQKVLKKVKSVLPNDSKTKTPSLLKDNDDFGYMLPGVE